MPKQIWKHNNNVKALCLKKGWTARDLRERMGNYPPLSTVFKWFRQERQPGHKYVDRLLVVFNCTKHQLFYPVDEQE